MIKSFRHKGIEQFFKGGAKAGIQPKHAEKLLYADVQSTHPGTVLRDYLDSVPVTAAAKHLGVTRAALSRILNGSAEISAEMALRLSDALGTSPELWIGMQAQYDLWQASEKRRRKLARLLVA